MADESIKNENLGWDEFFEANKNKPELADFSVARVIAEYKGGYKVKNDKGEFLAKITGKQIFNAKSREDYPAVGDWVAINELDNNQALIQAVLPRKSIIKRRFGDRNKAGEKSYVQVIATNIDVAFIVQSVGRDYNINRFERYLAIIEDGSIKPVIILNKIDLINVEELAFKLAEIKSRLGDVDVIATSALNDKGLIKLKNYIEKGKTYCFLGSSGVGKSSLINKLLGKDNIKTGDISSYSDRGKHITTVREMYILDSGGIVIDNPGIREVGMADAGAGINNLYNEINNLAKNCRYSDCEHVQEPGCAVLAALEDGKLVKDRYANYINLKKETEYFEMNGFEKRDKKRQFGKFVNKAKKDLKNFGHKYYG